MKAMLPMSAIVLSLALSSQAFAFGAINLNRSAEPTETEEVEFDPYNPEAMQTLFDMDQYFEADETAHIYNAATCQRQSCQLWVRVNKVTQTLSIYMNGSSSPMTTWPVSTGLPGRGTPSMETRFNPSRIYKGYYMSNTYPGGNYMGLGNMPYAMFLYCPWKKDPSNCGFAIHGTPQSNWKRLGQKASHGCVRVHPDNAKYLNGLIRSVGTGNVWVTIE